MDFLETALSVVASTGILHLSDGLDHCCETLCGDRFEIKICEVLGDARLVIQKFRVTQWYALVLSNLDRFGVGSIL